MTGVVVFLGPTLPAAEAARLLDADYRPPAAHGDVPAAADAGARVIALIDGYFRDRPAVWHKELLSALAGGIHVFGGASLGALRAAELAPFGMVGVGRIFEAYRDGAIVRDDAVAVDHGPAELGFLPVSEPLVNIRATLAAALRQGVIGGPLAVALTFLAEATFYADLAWTRLIADARAAGQDAAALDTLAAWLPAGRVDLKCADAEALLRHVAAFVATDPPPFAAAFALNRTRFWREAEIRRTNPLVNPFRR